MATTTTTTTTGDDARSTMRAEEITLMTICSKNSSNRALIEFLIPCHYRQDVADAQNFLIHKVALHWTRRELPKILTEELCDFVETVT